MVWKSDDDEGERERADELIYVCFFPALGPTKFFPSPIAVAIEKTSYRFGQRGGSIWVCENRCKFLDNWSKILEFFSPSREFFLHTHVSWIGAEAESFRCGRELRRLDEVIVPRCQQRLYDVNSERRGYNHE